MEEPDEEDSQDRLGEALTRLDPRSRRLVELWLAGLGRREIALEMRTCDEVVAAIGEAAFRRLRLLLDGDSRREWPADEGAAGDARPAMTHSRHSPGCLDESSD